MRTRVNHGVLGTSGGHLDPALAGLATTAVIEQAVRQRPTLVVVDDAQWFDDETSASLAFALRRLTCQPLCVVIATRAADADPFTDFPVLRLSRLTTDDAIAVLQAAILVPMNDAVQRRIVAEAGGNPGMLLTAAAGATAAAFAGGFGHPVPIGWPRWLDALGPDERMLLIIAAAESTGDPALLWRAVDQLAIDRRAVTRLEDGGRLRLGSLVLFADPAERMAVYHSANRGERKTAHRALTAATDSPAGRAWHLALAAIGPDDVLAAKLDSLSEHVRGVAGQSATAAFLEQSALLTGDSQLRAIRALRAADAHLTAGSPSSTAQMLVTAALGAWTSAARQISPTSKHG